MSPNSTSGLSQVLKQTGDQRLGLPYLYSLVQCSVMSLATSRCESQSAQSCSVVGSDWLLLPSWRWMRKSFKAGR
ncbi:hypothetical protein EYF80_044487 [Liparis tanakae]|uniref:Uncharacterized protein n=1 Tax=Liparis tanakae TaxID=230148 RepID=A0A4Z2FYA1_9TELE|nr:hypothetical protein EYF80_044487 [Liparis tanakae]